ncbi:nectin-1-like [Chanos chanos]|uniref:Nectin-1-like n=1 Tax=Chanos chanos TaxID=29144 RepID=A0A6J2WJF7_CHACN|nr:nectin-1-like [Chanos chanos]
MASRGLRADMILRNETWLSGSKYLLHPEQDWPVNPDHSGELLPDLPEVKKWKQLDVAFAQADSSEQQRLSSEHEMAVAKGQAFRAAQVISQDETVAAGENANLLCQLTGSSESELLSSITWQKKTEKDTKKQIFASISPDGKISLFNGDWQFDRVIFIGNTEECNGSIQIRGVDVMDEGAYTCIFTMYPDGTYDKTINLMVTVHPLVTVFVEVVPVVGESEEVMATCTAAGARPPANISWRLGSFSDSMKIVTNSTVHSNGTYTTTSHLISIPTRHANQQQVRCVVSHITGDQTVNYTIHIHYPPESVKIIPVEHTTQGREFRCDVEANPKPSFTWIRENHGPPAGAQEDRLILSSLSPDLNGLYICKASNQYGEASGSVYVHVSLETSKTAVIIAVLLSFIIFIGLLCWIISKKYPGERVELLAVWLKRKREKKVFP